MTHSRKKLVLVFGAGASEALGFPGTRELSNAVRDALRERDGYPDLTDLGSQPEIVRNIKAERPARVEPLIDSIRRAGSANFESDMNVIESMMTLAPLSDVQLVLERTRARDPEPENVWGQIRPRSAVSKLVRVRSIYEALFDYDTLMNLMDVILATVRRSLKSVEKGLNPAKITAMSEFLKALNDNYQLAIYTFNYDTTVDSAVTQAFGTLNDGFQSDGSVGRFSPRSFLDGSDMRIAHLHGATNFRVSRFNASGVTEYAVVKSLPTSPRNLSSYAESYTQAGDFALIGSIITGLRKAEKTRTEPYGTYAFALERDLLEAERVLLVGYGGGDIYFNHQLLRARAYHGSTWKPAIVTYQVPRPVEILFLLACGFANISVADMIKATEALAGIGSGKVGALHLDMRGWNPENSSSTEELIHALA